MFILEFYVDDIIFGRDDKLYNEFSAQMQKEFEMLMTGELSFFLKLNVSHSNGGILISQSKYIKEILKKFGMSDCRLVATLMNVGYKLRKNDESLEAYQKKFRSMIGGIMYLIALRLDIMKVVCLVARF